MRSVTIPARFHGPPGSGNGGYSCGAAAVALGAGSTSVRLRVPPPLDRPLRVEHSDDGIVLLDDATVVAEARPAPVTVEPPEPITFDAAVAALERFDVAAYEADHAFPTCFTCGPHRAPGDGLRLFPAPVPGHAGMVVSPWTPHADHVDADGAVSDEILWAALDCPGGLAWIVGDPPTGPAVLGELTASIVRRTTEADRLVVAGWRLDADGRKHRSGTAVWTSDGDLVALGEATWIVLGTHQHAGFGARP